MKTTKLQTATYGSLWKSNNRTLNNNAGSCALKAKPAAPSNAKELFTAWSASWKDVFNSKDKSSDLIAGLTVAATALPLNIALAVACGLPPIAGLVAGAIGGAVAAIMGGSSLQVTGPAAALSTMVLAIAVKFGAQGVAVTCLVVGLVQLGLCAMKSGRLIGHVPESVLAGFTTGVGLKLIDSQVPKLLGLQGNLYEHLLTGDEWEWIHTISWHGVVCGLIVALFVITLRPWQKIPGSLIGIALVTSISAFFDWDLNRVGVVPSAFPKMTMPWIDPSMMPDLLMIALPLALLAAIESLISAKAVDRISKAKPFHENLELMGQGLANLVTGLFSGMPVSGVIVRSSVNAQSGGKTKLSALFHAVLLGVAILYFSNSLSIIPLAGLAGLLCVVGMRLIDIKTFVHLVQEEKIAAIAFVIAAWGTVSGHLMTGITIGLLVHFVGVWIHKKMNQNKNDNKVVARPSAGVRAVLGRSAHDARHLGHVDQGIQSVQWLSQIRQRAHVPASSFIHHRASVTGRVVLGQYVHIAAETSVRADEGSPFFIGDNSNVQDGVVMHALKEQWVQVGGESWAIYVGRNVSMAHQALIHGPCYIGDGSFVGFKAVVHDSIVGSNCFVGIGAVVVGVHVPEGRFIPHGKIVDTQEIADNLPEVTHQHTHFNDDVVEVNRGLAVAYHENKMGVLKRSTVDTRNLKNFAFPHSGNYSSPRL